MCRPILTFVPKSLPAQAEALVQLARQSILHIADDNPLNSGSIVVLAAYGESLTLERRLNWAEEGRMSAAPRYAEHKAVAAGAVFTQDGDRKSGSLRVCDMRTLEVLRSTNPSRSRICQPRRPIIMDSSTSISVSF